MTARRGCGLRLQYRQRHRQRHRQRGLVLVCALFLMLATAVVALSVARMAQASLSSAERERDRAVARAAAEAALRDGERDAENTVAPGAGAVGGCGACGGEDPPAWQVIDLAAAEVPDGVTVYGAATGARMAVGGGLLPARLPAYLVERLAPVNGGQPSANGGQAQDAQFRITAIGFGTRAAVRVVLQSSYRKPPAGPGRRTGWREIANWPELHARAVRTVPAVP